MKQMSVFVTLMQLPLVGSRSINQLVVSGNSIFFIIGHDQTSVCYEKIPIPLGFISTASDSHSDAMVHVS